VLEHHVRAAFGLAVIVELHDIRMGERRHRPCLTLEARPVGVGCQQLDRDVAAELQSRRATPRTCHRAEQLVEPVATGDDRLGHRDTLCQLVLDLLTLEAAQALVLGRVRALPGEAVPVWDAAIA